jgi:hypothetical protein
MNKNELKELVKRYFSLTEMTEETNSTENTEKQAFAEATLVDGTKVTNMSDGEFEVGQELHVITESGEHVIAPSGMHTTDSGITITVDGEGKITGIARPDEGGEGSLAEHDDEMKEEMSAEETEATEEKTELAEHGDEEEMEDESDIKEAIIEAIMSEVAPAIEELKQKMAEAEAKLAEHDEKMGEYMSKPAAQPTSESRFAKAKAKIENPRAVYNTKRYEAALSRITNK